MRMVLKYLVACAALGFIVFFSIHGSAYGPWARKAVRPDPSVQVALEWLRMALQAERQMDNFRAPVAARMYGYIGLAAYESAIPALAEPYRSIGNLFPGLCLPVATEGKYFLPALLNGCYATLYEKFFTQGPVALKGQLLELEKKLEVQLAPLTDDDTYQRSKKFGEQIATIVYDWSATDSLGHMAEQHLYDEDYVPLVQEGKWAPSSDFPLPALFPSWGKTRPFIIQTQDYLAKPHLPYSTLPSSGYYLQALEVYMLSKPLSAENKWIAEFWSDDQPGLTFTPSGRWISIANQVIESVNPDIGKTLETYLKVGFALNDAMVACWFSKFHYNLERPDVYINRFFDPSWRPVHHAPNFPAYPSGHAMMGSAVAEVLTGLYGTTFRMQDRSHIDRAEFKGMPRSFHSFYNMAYESAFSRIPLGVHFRMDSEEGIRLGKLVGQKINALNLENDNYGFAVQLFIPAPIVR